MKNCFEEGFNKGFPIKATFYVSYEWTDYSQVQHLCANGHMIASHTITHSFGTNFIKEKWANKVVGEAELLVRLAEVNPADITGMRAPFLAVGGDMMFNMLSRYWFYYVSSRPTRSLRPVPSLWNTGYHIHAV